MNKKTAGIFFGILALTAGIWFLTTSSQVWTGPGKTPAPKQQVQIQPSQRDVSKITNNGKKHEASKSGGINLGLYQKYLEGLCPNLTEAEENELLQRANRSPEMLIALASMKSKRGLAYINEALKSQPPLEIALFAAIARTDFKGDKTALAKQLGGVYGNLFQALDLAKNTATAADIIHALTAASTSTDSGKSPTRETLRLQEAAYIAVGRDPFGAKARVLLEENGQAEAAMLGTLQNLLTASKFFENTSSGEYAAALLLDLNQKMMSSQGFDLSSYGGARFNEMRMLQLMEKQYKLTESKYLEVSIPAALEEARAERNNTYEILLFSKDKAGIFQRIPRESQDELLQNISDLGEVAAYQNLFKQHPEVFSDPNFAPQGINKDSWHPTALTPEQVANRN